MLGAKAYRGFSVTPAHYCARVFPRKDKLADHQRRLRH
jgi:hypothetical protein